MRRAAAGLLVAALGCAGARGASGDPVREELVPPEFLSGPNPRYTQEAIDAGASGTVVVKCVLTAEGRVTDCAVLSSTIPMMNEALIETLQQRRYKPATLGGRPVDVSYTFRIPLSIVDDAPAPPPTPPPPEAPP